MVVVVMGAGLTGLTARGPPMQTLGSVVRLRDAGVVGRRGELLGDALGEGGGGGGAGHGHGGAGAVDQVGRRWHAGVVVADWREVAVTTGGGAGVGAVAVAAALAVVFRAGFVHVFAVFGGVVVVVVVAVHHHQLVVSLAGEFEIFVGELKALDGGGALLADVADDVGDGVGFVAEVTVGHVGHGEGGEAFAGAGGGGKELTFDF